ncbi:suppressor protein stp22 of temperature-sensitive alpha-factor receptor and arginine permease [Coemansia thaxteri]|nr:suppressor protein stp22 of temperature-sensitive alpha-factor receptor and arginine permease [Coemansia thaxteri]
MAYVTPTRTMVVKVSKHVDERGRVYHPYLADWSDTSTLGDLFRNLIAIFSVEPPVYSRPPGHTPVAMSPAIGPPSPAIGTMSVSSLPLQASGSTQPAAMAMNAGPAMATSQPQSFGRPMTSVENELASIHTVSATHSDGVATVVAPKSQTSDSAHASADSIEHDLSRISLESHTQAPPVLSTTAASEPVPAQQHHEYKFNPAVGRPPIPTLSPMTTTSDGNLSGQSQTSSVGQEVAVPPNALASPGGHEGPSSSGSAQAAIAEPAQNTMPRQEDNQAGTEGALPSSASPSDQPMPATMTALATAAASAAAQRAAQDVVSHSLPSPAAAATLPALGTPSARPTTPVTVKATAAAPKSPEPSSLLDSEPMDDPKKRLVGYQLAIYDRVTEAVDRSREKHTRVNKELLDQSANLNSGAGVIAEERRQLLESQRQLSSNISVLEKKLNELNEKKAEFPDADKIADVRHVFRGQTPAMEQLFDLAGEIAAIDDTLYVLSKALNDGKLTIGTYMRQVRKLAQQQFLAKALALKIRGLCSLDR